MPQPQCADKGTNPRIVHGFDEGQSGELGGESGLAECGLDVWAITAFDAKAVLKEQAVAALPREFGACEIAKDPMPSRCLVARFFSDGAVELSRGGVELSKGAFPACAVDGFGLIANSVPTDGAQAFFVEFLEAGALSCAGLGLGVGFCAGFASSEFFELCADAFECGCADQAAFVGFDAALGGCFGGGEFCARCCEFFEDDASGWIEEDGVGFLCAAKDLIPKANTRSDGTRDREDAELFRQLKVGIA